MVEHPLNQLPGLAELPDGITLPGLAEPNDYCPKRDPNCVFPLEAVRILAGFLTSNVSLGLMFSGPSGSGKSYLMRQIHAYLNRPLFYVTGHSSLEFEDLLGTKEIVDGDTITMHGPLVQAAEMPYATFLFEEIDRARSNVSVSLNPILDGYDIVHTLDSGRRIRPAEGFRIMSTANTNGLGDMTGQFNSANVMDSSLLKRFWCHNLWYPTEDEEFKILRQAVDANVPDDSLRRSITFANDVRYLFTGRDEEATSAAQAAGLQNAIHTTVSTREIVALWGTMSIFPDVPNPIAYALDLVLANKCTTECADAFHKLAEAQFAGDD